MEKLQNLLPENLTQRRELSDIYSEIQLTAEEKAAAIERGLFEARRNKAAALAQAEYREKVLAEPKPPHYSAEQLREFIQGLDGFDVDQDNSDVIRLLCFYFSDDERFEAYKDPNGRFYSLDKGILLFGGVGVGKTRLLEMFRNNQKASYQVVACQDVEGTYAKNGPDYHPDTGEMGLKKYFGLVSLATKNAYGHSALGFMFDDLGQELQTTKYFGTERNVMQEVLTQRYKNNLHDATHITTNLSAEQIKAVYGIRVADRMREMFNLIAFPDTAKSRRK